MIMLAYPNTCAKVWDSMPSSSVLSYTVLRCVGTPMSPAQVLWIGHVTACQVLEGTGTRPFLSPNMVVLAS